MSRWVLLLACCLLAACASAPTLGPPDARALLQDAAFRPPAEPVDAERVFELSPSMRAYLQAQLPPHRRDADLRRPLIDLLYRQQKLALEYDSSRTRTAAEAFEARAGNCLSLVIMTAAFAKALELPVRYQQVFVQESWSRSGDLQFASGHVNLALPERTQPTPGVVRTSEPALVIDFIPAADLDGRRTQALAERTIVAMFMNNRAAEVLAGGDVHGAYWWARASVLADATFINGYNTLGVVYLRRGLASEAERLFAAVLEREPENTKVLGNLASTLRQQGRTDAARAVEERLARIEPTPPFHFFHAGLQAMRERDYAKARELFAKELRREAYYHEFHYWMAQAELALGHPKQARRHLEMARQNSTTPRDQGIYAAKLDHLNAVLR